MPAGNPTPSASKRTPVAASTAKRKANVSGSDYDGPMTKTGAWIQRLDIDGKGEDDNIINPNQPSPPRPPHKEQVEKRLDSLSSAVNKTVDPVEEELTGEDEAEGLAEERSTATATRSPRQTTSKVVTSHGEEEKTGLNSMEVDQDDEVVADSPPKPCESQLSRKGSLEASPDDARTQRRHKSPTPCESSSSDNEDDASLINAIYVNAIYTGAILTHIKDALLAYKVVTAAKKELSSSTDEVTWQVVEENFSAKICTLIKDKRLALKIVTSAKKEMDANFPPMQAADESTEVSIKKLKDEESKTPNPGKHTVLSMSDSTKGAKSLDISSVPPKKVARLDPEKETLTTPASSMAAPMQRPRPRPRPLFADASTPVGKTLPPTEEARLSDDDDVDCVQGSYTKAIYDHCTDDSLSNAIFQEVSDEISAKNGLSIEYPSIELGAIFKRVICRRLPFKMAKSICRQAGSLIAVDLPDKKQLHNSEMTMGMMRRASTATETWRKS